MSRAEFDAEWHLLTQQQLSFDFFCQQGQGRSDHAAYDHQRARCHMFLPPGFNSVTAYLYGDDAPAFIEFLVNGLRGVEVLRALGEDGCVANAQIRLENSIVMVSKRLPSHPQMRAAHYLFVENTDQAMARAI